MKQSNTRGGTRPGAGRPRLGEARRVSATFSVDLSTLDRIRALREAGRDMNQELEFFIGREFAQHFGYGIEFRENDGRVKMRILEP